MKYVEVYDSSPELARAAAAGPHAGWNTFDILLEGARFHRLHELLSGPAFGLAERVEAELAIRELESLASSNGYGDADGWIARRATHEGQESTDTDQPLTADDFETDDYLAQVISSERLLRRAAATSEARTFINFEIGEGGAYGPLHRRMAEAYMEGRRTRFADLGEIPRSVRILEPVATETLDECFEGMVLQSILDGDPDADEDDAFTALQSADFVGQGRIHGITLADLADFVEEARMSDTETAELLLPAFETELARASSDRTHIAAVDLEENGVTLTMLLRDALQTHPDGLGTHSFTVVETYRPYDPDRRGSVAHLVTAEGAMEIDPKDVPDESAGVSAPRGRGVR